MAPFFRTVREKQIHPWVIGGHRGRMYADNAAALHTYITQHTNTPIIWISMNDALTRSLRSLGHQVLPKNSIRARLAILRAPVLVYSHGEDDLDTFLKLFRGTLGLKVYLNHSLNYLKSGQMNSPGLDLLTPSQLKHFIYHIMRFDVLLASSPLEKVNFEKSFTGLPAKILPQGGGAHLDSFVTISQQVHVCKDAIVWFPTWRDTNTEAQNLNEVIQCVTTDPRLHTYLENQNLRLVVVGHINSSQQNTTPVHARVQFAQPTQILDLLAEAVCFISDYSGLIFDWLYLNRPIVHFPFDAEQYLQNRNLYTTLEELQYGPMAHTPQELIQILCNDLWRAMEPYDAKRQHWSQMIFPNKNSGFSERCYTTITELRATFCESSRSFVSKEIIS